MERSNFTDTGITKGICKDCQRLSNKQYTLTRFKAVKHSCAYTHVIKGLNGKLYRYHMLMGDVVAGCELVYVIPNHGHLLPRAMSDYDVIPSEYLVDTEKG